MDAFLQARRIANLKARIRRKAEHRRAILLDEEYEEMQVRNMIAEGCPNSYFKNDLTEVEDWTSQGFHAGVMHPVSYQFRMDVADGYFPDWYMRKIREFEELSEPQGEWNVINQWYSNTLNGYILVGSHKLTGRRKAFFRERGQLVLEMMYNTYLVQQQVWKTAHEERAMSKLKTHINGMQYSSYLMTGQFVEQSKKSGVHYIFRRCRPTIAMRFVPNEGWKLLAGLCFHSVGYYVNSWCGALVPTDDVIAHLLMMRADEHNFWKKANHHTLHTAQLNL